MAIDRRIGSKVAKTYRKEEASGIRVDPFPYIGIVKNNLDPTRCGRLQVWIPELGGDKDDPQNWRTVSYASPFMGTTNIVRSSNFKNKYDQVPHTYGMWMVPPDIGIEVLVLFVAGDPHKGYWLACVNSSISRYMLPGLASSTFTDTELANASVKKSLTTGTQYPVTEFNTNDLSKVTNSGFLTNPKPIHEDQFYILREQGLDRDRTRGTVTSSSQRETPSNVFGISTPGRSLTDPTDDPNFKTRVEQGLITEDAYAVPARKGGHTFIMDDGDAAAGDDQLIRLRTAKGHQIMMHDSKNTFYLANADGTVWIELGFDDKGMLNLYAKQGINIRSENDINMHSDTNINIHAKKNISIKSEATYQVESVDSNFITESKFSVQSGTNTDIKVGAAFNVDADATMSLRSDQKMVLRGSIITQNTDPGTSLKDTKRLVVNKLPDTAVNSENLLWEVQPKKLSSIVTIAPTHEPYDRSGSAATSTKSSIQPTTYSGTQDKTKTTQGTEVKNAAGDKDLRNQPPCNCQVGNLTSDQLTAYYAQIGKSESGGNYQAVNSIGFVGKYQFGYPALIDAGLVKSSCKSNSQLNNPNNWVGGDGKPGSLEEFLANEALQEQVMCEYTKRNYNAMVRNGAITSEMPPEEVGGMLATSHLLGAGGAKKWRNGEGGSDAYGTTGDTYFQKGKYAVSVLGPKVATVQNG